MLSGVKVISKKKMSLSDKIIEIKNPEIVYIPLVNHTNLECECLVKEGEEVLKGSIIGKRNDNIDFNIHSSVSGKVIGIEEKLYLNGEKVRCVVIKNDFKEKQFELKGAKDKIASYSKKEFVEILKTCSVTGMGGSDFPTYLKYDINAKILIVNAVECEPYITSDIMVAKLKTEEILEGIDAIIEINDLERAIIAIKEENYGMKARFEQFLGTYPKVSISIVKDMYPMGWERYLIKDVLKVNYDRYPSEAGIIVNNVSTIYEIYKALKYRRPISKRIITVTGDMLKHPQNVIVKIGTEVKNIVEELEGYKKGKHLRFIAGGPMMGVALESDDLIVSKNLNCVLITKDNEMDNAITCLRCGRCADVCPVKLCPVLIRDSVIDYEALKYLHPERCIECGLCSYVCPSKIDVRGAVKDAKKEIRRH